MLFRSPDADQLAQAAREFKVIYRKVPGSTGTSYTMEHTAASFVFDTQGRIRLYTRYGMGPKALAECKDLIRAIAHRPLDSDLLDDTAKRIARARASDEGREGRHSGVKEDFACP